MSLQIAYNAGDTTPSTASITLWRGQTFLTVGGFNLQSVKVLILKYSGTLVNLVASIRAVTGVPQSSKPTGEDLVSGTVSIASLGTTKTWIEVTFSPPLTLSATTRYAIIIRTDSGEIRWRKDSSAPNYEDGNAAFSTNSGEGWSTEASSDFLFETYSAPTVVPIAGTIVGEGTLAGDLGFLVLLPMQGSFIAVSSVSGGLSFPYDFWPVPRNVIYDATEGFLANAGGRYRNSIIAIGIDSNGLGVIYCA